MTVTPLESSWIDRLAKRSDRSRAGWLYLIIRERLVEEAAKEKAARPPAP